MNSNIIEKFILGSTESPGYQALSKKMQETSSTISAAELKYKIEQLQKLLIKEKKTHDWSQLFCSWLIYPWIHATTIISHIDDMSISSARKNLNAAKKTAKTLIKALENIKHFPDFAALCLLETEQELNIDKFVNDIKSFLEYITWFENIKFERGKSLSTSKLLETAFFALLFIGKEILGLSDTGKPIPLYTFIQIITDDSGNNKSYSSDKIGPYYERYKESQFPHTQELNEHNAHKFICNAHLMEKIETYLYKIGEHPFQKIS